MDSGWGEKRITRKKDLQLLLNLHFKCITCVFVNAKYPKICLYLLVWYTMYTQ